MDLQFDQNFFFASVLGASVILQLLLSVYMLITIRLASRERSQLNREMFGLLKKIEGLTAHKREAMLKHYDGILEDLSRRLPPTVAAEAGQMIFDMESKILSRLAELEPDLKSDESGLKKMDSLIRSMEGLESTLVALTADTVRNVMISRRSELFEEESSRKIAA